VTKEDVLKDKVASMAKGREAKRKADEADKEANKELSVSAGPVDKIVDVLINPAPHMILGFTDFDRNQVALIPQLGIIDDVWEHCIEIVAHNENPTQYEEKYKKVYPVLENPIKRFVYLLAQCRRSLGGKTQKALEDLALADLESRNIEGKESFGESDFES